MGRRVADRFSDHVLIFQALAFSGDTDAVERTDPVPVKDRLSFIGFLGSTRR